MGRIWYHVRMIFQNKQGSFAEEPFWAHASSDVVTRLQTDAEYGLTEEDAKERLVVFGKNSIERTRTAPLFFIFLNQFKNPLILLLVIAGTITLLINHLRDALFIFSTVLVNTGLGFYQEYKAERALAELKTYLKERARVVRNGVEQEVDATHLVPGDIVRLSQGDRVPADARVLFANDLQIDEAVLTGESLPSIKQEQPVAEDASLADRRSMVFAGTLVAQGVATVVVCQTDLSTELGKIATLVAESKREETPLQRAIRRFSLRASIFLTIITAIVFVVGVLFGYSKLEMFLMSVAIAVSAVPEGLPIAMTVILSTGVLRMARRKGVVRKLVAAEALGSATVIVTDKTGTLTMAKMELESALPVSPLSKEALLEFALLNTAVVIENPKDDPREWRMTGRALETALVRSAGLRGVMLEEVKRAYHVVESLPFNATNKFSGVVLETKGVRQAIFFGAPDVLLRHATMTEEKRNEMEARIDACAQAGEYVLGVASKTLRKGADVSLKHTTSFEGMRFKGLITLRDPVRPGVKEAIRRVEASGVRVVIVTGDHGGTAAAIAREVGISVQTNGILDARGLRTLSEKALQKRLPALTIVSRVSPADKLRLVEAFQRSGEVVAMTGDGVNDAPSMKRADIGISMGSGTQVTRDVADVVLLDDNFGTIAAAIEEGRQITGNIQKVLVYLLSSVTDGLILIGGSLLAGLALPMNPLQILWVNFFSGSLPAIAFAFEREGGDMHLRRVRGETRLFSPLMKYLILLIGISTSAFLFFLYWILLRAGYPDAIVRTFIFASFGTYSLFVAFSVRSLEQSIFTYPFFSNRFLLVGTGIGFVLVALGVYLPFFQSLFETVPLPAPWIVGVIVVGILNIGCIELGKWAFRRFFV